LTLPKIKKNMSNTNQTGTDVSKNCLITNQTDTDAVIIIPTTSQDGDVNSNSTIAVYDQNLEILPLVEGGYTIKAGQSATVVLDQYYTDPTSGESTYSIVYNLLVSSADWYYPMANIGVMQNIFANPVQYDPQTASSDEKDSIANAAVFYQTIQAYPTSQLATDYQAAMSGTISNASSQANGSDNSTDNCGNAIEEGVDAFFQGTKQFQNVTLASVTAIESYYDEFPFIWARFKSVIYYLYSSDGQNTSFVGQLALAQPSALDLTQPNAGYTCTFSPATDSSNLNATDVDSSKAKSLTYLSGVFVDNENKDIPAIALKGVFQLKSTFTQVPADTDIVPVITGSVDGFSCIGFDEPQTEDDDSSSYWKTLFEPQGAEEIINSIMTIGGLIMTAHFFATALYGIGKWIWQKKYGKKPTTEEVEFNKKMDDFQKAMNDKIDAAVQKISDGKQQAPKDPDDAMKKINDEETNVLNNENRDNIEKQLEKESVDVQDMAQDMSKMNQNEIQQLESNANQIKESENNLVEAPKGELGQVVQEEQQNQVDIQKNVNDLDEEVSSSLSKDAQDQIKKNTEVNEEINKEIDDSEKENEEVKANDDPKIEDDFKPIEF
jgi:hypothetical protein